MSHLPPFFVTFPTIVRLVVAIMAAVAGCDDVDARARDDTDSGTPRQTAVDASSHADADRSVEVPAGGVAPRTRENFREVAVEFGPMRFSVEGSGALILADEKGAERFDLSNEDYERVLDLVVDPAFMDAIWDTADCQSVPDATVIVTATFSDIGSVADTMAASCASVECEAGTPGHVYGRLACLLYDFWRRYMQCPLFDPATEKASRRLCSQCWYFVEDAPNAC